MLLSIPEICCEIHVIIYSFMCKSFRFGLLRPYHSKNEKYAKREIFWSNLPVVDFLCLPACQLSNLVVARLQLSLCSVSVYSSWFGVRTRGEWAHVYFYFWFVKRPWLHSLNQQLEKVMLLVQLLRY